MKCEDCLPLLEEYFDGETDARAAEMIGAHLSKCADCAAALDALRFEQDLYARYERGIEVTPALWAAVSASVARGPRPRTDADERRPFLTRLRCALAASLGALALRPALASSLALLLVGVTAGALWLARVRPAGPPRQSASNEPGRGAGVNRTPAPVVNQDEESPVKGTADGGASVAALSQPKSRPESAARAEEAGRAPRQARPDESVEKLLAYTPPAAGGRVVVIREDEHETRPDSPAVVDIPATGKGLVTADARLADPGDKEFARHVERAQMLLRSIKNARPADGGTLDVAYEKKNARRLLAENATLQLDAETRGDKDTQQVLDQIEPFLLDIANLRDQPSSEEVRSIKERMRKNEIIAALQVY